MAQHDVQRAVHRHLLESEDAVLTVSGADPQRLVPVLNAFIERLAPELEDGRLMHTGQSAPATEPVLLALSHVTPDEASRAVGALHDEVTAMDPGAALQLVPQTWFDDEETATGGSIYVHVMPRWRPDVQERQRARLEVPGGRAKLTVRDMDTATRAKLIDAVIDWVMEIHSPVAHHYSRSNDNQIVCSPHSAAEVFRWAVSGGLYRGGLGVVLAGHIRRDVRFESLTGGVLCRQTWQQLPGPDEMTVDARKLVARLAPYSESSYAVASRTPRMTTGDLEKRYSAGRNFRPSAMSRLVVHEPRKVVDAFPIQFLGPVFNDRALEPDHYSTKQVADGRLLVHHEASQWFTSAGFEQLDQKLVGSARAELSEIIATADDIEAAKQRIRERQQ